MKLEAIVNNIGEYRLKGDSSIDIKRIVADSREVRPGDLFAAMRGCTVDSHEFIPMAVEAGATALITESGANLPEGVAQIIVEDARSALGKAADAFYGKPSAKLKLTGITGTNGKTTTCYILAHVLREAGYSCGQIGTVEYIVGEKSEKAPVTTPDALFLHEAFSRMVSAGDEAAVMEVSSHALDQGRTAGVRFDAAVFTNLSGDHLDYHREMHAYARAKARLFESLEGGAFALINMDDPAGELMYSSSRGRKLAYGMDKNADYWASVTGESIEGAKTIFDLKGEKVEFLLPLVGRYNVMNALAAAAVAREFGVNAETIMGALSGFRGVPGRLERVPGGNGFGVFVDYAHTDEALENVLGAMRDQVKGRLIAVFGCGGDRDRTKRPRMAQAVEKWADLAVLTSDNPRTEDPERILDDAEKGFSGKVKYVRETDRAKGIEIAIKEAGPGDAVVIAGKGHEDYQVRGTKRYHFDDREVAAEVLGKIKK